jgi:hypothetical protein
VIATSGAPDPGTGADFGFTIVEEWGSLFEKGACRRLRVNFFTIVPCWLTDEGYLPQTHRGSGGIAARHRRVTSCNGVQRITHSERMSSA